MQKQKEILNVLNVLSLQPIFWETKIFLKMLEYFSWKNNKNNIWNNNIERTVFPQKTALLEAGTKRNRM